MPFRTSRINSKPFYNICRIINQFDTRNFLKSLVKAERSGYNYVNKINKGSELYEQKNSKESEY